MASNTTREQVASALFNLVTVAVGNVVGLKTSSRRIKLPEDVAPKDTPALFQVQTKEHVERTQDNRPPRRTMVFDLVLYVTDAANTIAGLTLVPSTQLNTMIQAIESVFAPDPTTNSSTLGGLVAWARLEGEIDYLESRTVDGKSIAVIPVSVLVP